MQSRFQPGTMIVGRFRLERPLGEGAYGEVWRAVQLPVERPVAIKLLKPSSDHFARQRFDREARAMAAINHPNCITFFDFGHLPGDAGSFLVSELVEGETLRDWMRQGRSIVDKVLVCQQIVGAVGAAHAQQVLHRDLKPENIMVAHDHQRGHTVKVLDFGLSKIVDDERRDITKTGEIFGTPGYMSPEQLRGQEISAKTDLYSFGVILFELLEGRPPYFGPTAHETCMMHLTAPVPAVTADVPPALAQLASRLLAKDPNQRPTGPEISRILQASAAGAPTVEQAPARATAPAAPRAETVHERPVEETASRTPLFVGAAVVLSLTLFAAISLLGKEDAAPPPQATGSQNVDELTKPKVEEPDRVDVPAAIDAGTDASTMDAADARVCDLERGVAHQFTGSRGWALLQLPESSDPSKPIPILVLLHEAFFQDPTWYRDKTDLFKRASEEGFAIVAPNDGSRPWHNKESWDAVMSSVALARELMCLDDGPLFVFGYGAGGWGAESMACHFEEITATVAVSHRLEMNEKPCEMERVVPHLTIWPMKDPWDPVEGGTCPFGQKPKQTLDAHRELLRARHGCTGRGKTKRFAGKHSCTWHKCETALTSCEVEAGRPWPGLYRSLDPCSGGRAAPDFPYSDILWKFLNEHAGTD